MYFVFYQREQGDVVDLIFILPTTFFNKESQRMPNGKACRIIIWVPKRQERKRQQKADD